MYVHTYIASLDPTEWDNILSLWDLALTWSLSIWPLEVDDMQLFISEPYILRIVETSFFIVQNYAAAIGDDAIKYNEW